MTYDKIAGYAKRRKAVLYKLFEDIFFASNGYETSCARELLVNEQTVTVIERK